MRKRTGFILLAITLMVLFVAHVFRYEPLRTEVDGSRVVTVVWDRWAHQRCLTVYSLGVRNRFEATEPGLVLRRCY